MKKTLVAALALAMAAPAFAAQINRGPVDRSNTPIIDAIDLGLAGSGVPSQRAVPVYKSIGPGTGGYAAFSPAAGPVGFDDYVTTLGAPFSPSTFKFVGQVTANGPVAGFPAGGGGVAFFTFFNTAASAITSIGVRFPIGDGLGHLWTLGPIAPGFFTSPVPNAGFIQMYVDPGFFTASHGAFWLTTPDAVVVGGNNPAVGGASTSGGAFFVHAFELDAVPDPATLSLLGLGSLFLARRRGR